MFILFLFRTSKERFRSARFRQFRVVLAGTRWILIDISDFLNISRSNWEGVPLILMRLHELAKVIIDVIVVSRAWQVEHCLSLINVVILTTARSPGAPLSARLSTLLDLNTAR